MEQYEENKEQQPYQETDTQRSENETTPQQEVEEQKVRKFVPRKFTKNTQLIILASSTIIFASLSFFLIRYLQPSLKTSQNNPKSPSLSETWQTPTPDSTENWKIHTSGQFTFQYPADWTTLTQHVFDLVVLVNRTDFTEYEFSIGTLPEAQPFPSRCMKQINSEPMEIDNFPTQKIILRNDPDYQEENSYLCYDATREEPPEIAHISFDSKGKSYLLSFKYPISKSKEAQIILDQILSTFQFSDQDEESCISEGEEGNYFRGQKCCSGLKELAKTAGTPTCAAVTNGSFICGICGNNICGLGEDICNCREDCRN